MSTQVNINVDYEGLIAKAKNLQYVARQTREERPGASLVSQQSKSAGLSSQISRSENIAANRRFLVSFEGQKEEEDPAARLAGKAYFIAHGNWSIFLQDSFDFKYDDSFLTGKALGGPGDCAVYYWVKAGQALTAALSNWFDRAPYGENKAESLNITNTYKQNANAPAKVNAVGDDSPLLEYLPTTAVITSSDSFLIYGYQKGFKIYCYITRVVWPGAGGNPGEDRRLPIRWDFIEETPEYELKNQTL